MSRKIIGTMVVLSLIATIAMDRSARLAAAAEPQEVTDVSQVLWSFDAGG